MPDKLMRVHIPAGSTLSNSQKTPGRQSPLTRDSATNKLGQVTLSEVDESEFDSSDVYVVVNQGVQTRDETAELIAALVIAGIRIAAEKAAPHVGRWLHDSAVPAVKASPGRLAKAVRRGKPPKDTETAVVVQPAAAEPSAEVNAKVETPTVSMTSAEWQESFRLMLLTGAFEEEQWRLLSTAHVEDAGALLEVQSAMENLSPQQIAEGMRLALEARSSVLDPETSAAMNKTFAGVRIEDSKRAVPIGDKPRLFSTDS